MSFTLRPSLPAAVAVVSAMALALAPTNTASADVVYHDVEYSVEASDGGGTLAVQYANDQHDHSDPTEKHLTQEVVELPWSGTFRIGEADYRGGKSAPDSKPFKGLVLGLTATTQRDDFDDGLMDGSGKLNGPQAWDAWTGGHESQEYYTCRITVDGKVVAEQTMRGLCSAAYKQHSRTAP